ncbi:MAG: molybdenum cofactor biosynthesis protein MoaE [Thermoplasmata archaeon]
MKVEITDGPIDVGGIINGLRNDECGSILTFQGTVRKYSDDAEVTSLFYEAYKELAIAEIKKLLDEALERYGIVDATVVHRIGNVNLREDSVVISVCSRHRSESFEACRFIIDEIKARIPIWKKDIKPDGSQKWH